MICVVTDKGFISWSRFSYTPYSCKEKDSRRLTVYLHLPDSPGVRRNITCINPDQVSLFLHYLYNRGSEMNCDQLVMHSMSGLLLYAGVSA